MAQISGAGNVRESVELCTTKSRSFGRLSLECRLEQLEELWLEAARQSVHIVGMIGFRLRLGDQQPHRGTPRAEQLVAIKRTDEGRGGGGSYVCRDLVEAPSVGTVKIAVQADKLEGMITQGVNPVLRLPVVVPLYTEARSKRVMDS